MLLVVSCSRVCLRHTANTYVGWFFTCVLIRILYYTGQSDAVSAVFRANVGRFSRELLALILLAYLFTSSTYTQSLAEMMAACLAAGAHCQQDLLLSVLCYAHSLSTISNNMGCGSCFSKHAPHTFSLHFPCFCLLRFPLTSNFLGAVDCVFIIDFFLPFLSSCFFALSIFCGVRIIRKRSTKKALVFHFMCA